ncbi:phage holin family protein [Paenalkalicoccus suaedae]|uniref:Phage holin family protein n=1 Tax=Paenalkalicoccus suaedae TaxID=2592382 RepID=A0A859FHZ5_9BACI|nr:phage holin family protein [Paenalkalicoccus suaedae]QKS72272.1 phage holin family protein [Paenalkalicoccus suaedae]
MRFLIQILVNAVILFGIAGIFQSVEFSGFGAAIVAALILAVVNIIVKPILVILTLPITILSLGLFLFVINGITLLIVQAVMGNAFNIDGLFMSIVVALIFAILNAILQRAIVDPLTK